MDCLSSPGHQQGPFDTTTYSIQLIITARCYIPRERFGQQGVIYAGSSLCFGLGKDLKRSQTALRGHNRLALFDDIQVPGSELRDTPRHFRRLLEDTQEGIKLYIGSRVQELCCSQETEQQLSEKSGMKDPALVAHSSRSWLVSRPCLESALHEQGCMHLHLPSS